jgi:hypothetical protein
VADRQPIPDPKQGTTIVAAQRIESSSFAFISNRLFLDGPGESPWQAEN